MVSITFCRSRQNSGASNGHVGAAHDRSTYHARKASIGPQGCAAPSHVGNLDLIGCATAEFIVGSAEPKVLIQPPHDVYAAQGIDGEDIAR